MKQYTEEDFMKIIKSKYPYKTILRHSNNSNIVSVYVLGYPTQLDSLDLSNTEKVATHMWQNNHILKDVDGLFLDLPAHKNSITDKPLAYEWRAEYLYPKDIEKATHLFKQMSMSDPNSTSPSFNIPEKSFNCRCGAHSVGSNSHSSWCEIKESI